MKNLIIRNGIVVSIVALPLLAGGCNKKESATKEGAAKSTGTAAATSAGTATATGAGTAAATGTGTGTGTAAATGTAAGSAAATGTDTGATAGAATGEAAAPWAADTAPSPATSKVTGKRNGVDEGTFDRALYFKSTDKYDTTSHTVMISTGCDTFSCAHVDWLRGGVYTNDEKLSADCPSAKVMTVKLNVEGDPKPGPVDVSISINSFTSGGDLSGEEWSKGSSLTAVTAKELQGKISLKDGESAASGDFAAKVCGTVVQAK
jgi:hypothetical protein